MNVGMTQFINTGLDDYLAKSFNRSGLVQVLTTVNGRHGTYQRMQWVRPGEAAKVVEQEFTSRDAAKENGGKEVKPIFLPIVDAAKSTTRVFSAEQVLEHYKKSGSRVDLATFTKRNYFVSNGVNSTTELYLQNDHYVPQRKVLHDQIISDIMAEADTAAAGERPICYLLGGGTASGKSTVRNKVITPTAESEGIRMATVDADDIKTRMPEYKPFQDQLSSKAAVRVHKESGDITSKAIHSLIKARKHFIYDGTMARTDKYLRLVDELQEAGYDVRMVVVTVPLEEAKRRAAERAKKENRTVPTDIIENTHGGCSITYPEIAPLVDHFELWDNSGETPVLIQQDEDTYDEDAFEAFIQKGVDHQAKRQAAEAARKKESVAYGA